MRSPAVLPLALVAVLLTGCSSTPSDDPETIASSPSAPPSAASSSAPTTSTLAAAAALVLDDPADLSSACVRGTGSKTRRAAVWQPTFTAEGGDVVIREVEITGQGVTLFDAEGTLVEPGTRTSSADFPWPVDAGSVPEGGTPPTALRGTRIPAGSTVLPLLGVEFAPSATLRGAKLADVVLTYTTGDGPIRTRVEGALEISYPNVGKRCF